MKKLLVVDLQKQFKDKNGEYERIVSNIDSLKSNYEKVYATVFTQIDNPNYITKLNWNGCKNCSHKDLEFDIDIENVIIKNGYGIKNITNYFSSDDEIDIIGCDSDACVMAVCFQLWDLGYNFNILSDNVYTTASYYSNESINKILKRNFGSCVK